MANPTDVELLKLEAALEAERANRAKLPLSLPDDAPVLVASYERSNVIEDQILALRATTPRGFLVKVREITYALEAEGNVPRWLDNLERDLEAAADH